MPAKKSLTEQLYPIPNDFKESIKGFKDDAFEILLGYVWQGYEQLINDIRKIKLNPDTPILEDEITNNLYIKIANIMPSEGNFILKSWQKEYETKKEGASKTPEYDLAFALRSNHRKMFCLEAKILKTDKDKSNYIKEIEHNFLTARYSPFSREGGMLGYLIQGSPEVFFKNLKNKNFNLMDYPKFPGKPHKYSKHKRAKIKNPNYPKNFTCHHLILSFSVLKSNN